MTDKIDDSEQKGINLPYIIKSKFIEGLTYEQVRLWNEPYPLKPMESNPWRETAKERPPRDGTYIVFCEGMIAIMSYSAKGNYWCHTFEVYSSGHVPTHWKHLSLSPKIGDK